MIVRSEHFRFDRDKARETERLAHDQMLSQEQRDLISQGRSEQPFFSEPASHCFYCGEKLTIPAVMWNGRTTNGSDAAEIWLHPKCAEAFRAHLARDLDELKLGKQVADEKLRDWKRQQSA